MPEKTENEKEEVSIRYKSSLLHHSIFEPTKHLNKFQAANDLPIFLTEKKKWKTAKLFWCFLKLWNVWSGWKEETGKMYLDENFPIFELPNPSVKKFNTAQKHWTAVFESLKLRNNRSGSWSEMFPLKWKLLHRWPRHCTEGETKYLLDIVEAKRLWLRLNFC